jgi:tetratricopeptide (TPR) repeat protein
MDFSFFVRIRNRMSVRLEQLKKFLDEDPNDPFNLYALALELTKSDSAEAIKLFEKLMAEHITYLPTYYHAAKLYETSAMADCAIAVYKKGIEQAKAQQQFKTLRELQSALDELVFE